MNNFTAKSLWADLLKKIEFEIGPETVELWLKPVKPLLFEGKTLKIEVPDSFVFETLRGRYEDRLVDILKDITGDSLSIEYSVPINADTPVNKPAPALETAAVGFSRDAPSVYGPLNQNYTFESFVVGSSNRWAHATASAVAKKPGDHQFNPFFLYSPPGLGKTHLLHAIGNELLVNNPGSRVLYIPCEEFVNEYIGSMQNKTAESFRNKFRRLDCLLLDDVQFLIGKARSEEEFFYTFNSLFESKKQVVISSDRTPRELSLDQRLISRFLSGAVADMKSPDVETRIAILRKKRDVYGFSVPDDVLTFVAESVKSSIRELEGCLKRIESYSVSHDIQPTRDTAKEILRDIIANQEPDFRVSIDTIKKIVADKYSMDERDLKSSKRSEAIAFPRQICMYLACELTEFSLPAVGEAFSRDHTTVMYARDKIKQMLHSDPYISETINQLILRVKSVEK
ncbi:MAG: chromosomal replication initiator protein DnaA [bacterium]